MKTLTLKTGSLTYYASCEELPADLHLKYQRYLMEDAGIGSTVEDYGQHLLKLMELCRANLLKEAATEANNLYFNVFSIFNRVNHKGYALACLIHSLDGMPVADYSKEGIKNLYGELERRGITYGQIEEIISEVKKKLSSELKVRFPKWFGDTEEMNFNCLLLQKLRLEVSHFTSNKPEIPAKIKDLETEILTWNPPKNLNGSDPKNAITLLENEFSSLCTQLEISGISNPQKLTVFELYSKIEFLDKKTAKNEHH